MQLAIFTWDQLMPNSVHLMYITEHTHGQNNLSTHQVAATWRLKLAVVNNKCGCEKHHNYGKGECAIMVLLAGNKVIIIILLFMSCFIDHI